MMAMVIVRTRARRIIYGVAVAATLAVTVVASVMAATESESGFAKGPYIQSLTTTGVTVMWETDKPLAGKVEYGDTAALGHAIKAGGDRELQTVRIDGLAPGKACFYRVTAGDSVSPVCSFSTLPERGAFTFVAYGDTRTNPGDHATVISMIKARKPAFVLHCGDLVADGRSAGLWEPEFFKPAGPLISGTCMFTATGNHENESSLYYAYFGSHDGKHWYSFDCSNAHFTILDSCTELEAGSEQHKWLENDLASTKQRWRFAVFHHPPYSSGPHGDDFELRDSLDPLFVRYGVDMILNGHEHDYERTLPMLSLSGNKHPLMYVVTGGGGAPRYIPKGDYCTAAKLTDLNYCVIAIDGDKLRLDAYDSHDRDFDSVEIVKSGDGYSNGYPGRTVPLELTEVEAAVGLAIVESETASHSQGTTMLKFAFAAPAWSDLRLDLEWKASQGAQVTPATAHVEIPKGGRSEVSAGFKHGAAAKAAPIVTVRGATSLGAFTFDIRGVHFRKHGAPRAPLEVEAEEE